MNVQDGPERTTRGWWKQWIDPASERTVPAIRARLRRADGWQEAMLEPAAIDLASCLGGLDSEPRLRMALNLATVLAHVKEDLSGQRLMRVLGYRSMPTDLAKADAPILSRLRFTRLLRSTPEELPLALIRLVRMNKGAANVGELGAAMMRWPFETSREGQRRRWAFDYYAASAQAPDNSLSDPSGSAPADLVPAHFESVIP